MISNTRYAVWNGDFRQTGTAFKSIPSNTRHAVRNRDFGQSGTVRKSIISNTRPILILVMLSGMVIFVKLVQLSKA